MLLCVGGHLGDAVIATSAVALLARSLPDVQLGVAVGSWAAAALEGHPRLRWIHAVDHWKSNRSRGSLPRKWRHYRRTRRRALGELRAVGYDAAVDLFPYYPNMAWLLWRARIPVRIGYTSGGRGPLYTHSLDWVDTDSHTAEQHAALLRLLTPAVERVGSATYDLPPLPASAVRATEDRLRAADLAPGAFLVIHMGAGRPLKEWPRENWRELAQRLVAEGYRLVFTGSGPEEARLVRSVVHDLPGCVDLCDRLDWPGFRCVLHHAALVLCVDTVTMHLAAAAGTPCIAIMNGMSSMAHWGPLGTSATTLINPVPCAPCYRRHGCGTMACVRGVSVEVVLETARRRLFASDATATAVATR